jgi:hypothetical protein
VALTPCKPLHQPRTQLHRASQSATADRSISSTNHSVFDPSQARQHQRHARSWSSVLYNVLNAAAAVASTPIARKSSSTKTLGSEARLVDIDGNAWKGRGLCTLGSHSVGASRRSGRGRVVVLRGGSGSLSCGSSARFLTRSPMRTVLPKMWPVRPHRDPAHNVGTFMYGVFVYWSRQYQLSCADQITQECNRCEPCPDRDTI